MGNKTHLRARLTDVGRVLRFRPGVLRLRSARLLLVAGLCAAGLTSLDAFQPPTAWLKRDVCARGQAEQPGAVPQLPPQPGSAAPSSQRFTGHPISLEFEGADLRAVLRTFADISGLNIVIDQSVQGAVDVSLNEVPWDQALDIILRDHKLGYSVEGTIVRIAPLAVLSDEEAQRRKLADERALSGDLELLTRPLSYAKASDLSALLTRTALSPQGRYSSRSADQHDHHSRPRQPAPERRPAPRCARPPATSGGDRGADCHHDTRFRAKAGRAMGLQRARGARSRQYDRPGVSQSGKFERADGRGSGSKPGRDHRSRLDRGQPWHLAGDQCHRPGARLREWRVQPRRGA